MLRFTANLLELVDEAEASVNRQEKIGAEGRAGLLNTLNQLRNALSPSGSGNPIQNYFPNMNTDISQFSLIADFVEPAESLAEAADQALSDIDAELTELYDRVQSADIDGDAKKAVLANLSALQVLLRNTSLFGFDAAKSAYIDLLSTIQRHAAKADPSARTFFEGLWGSIEVFAGRLTLINGAVYAGQQLFEAGKPLLRLVAPN